VKTKTGEIMRLEEILAYSQPENPWVKVYFDKVKFPGGSEGRYNRLVECDGRTGVAILPLCGSRVGLVRQFRYPIGRFQWEIPRGFGGEGGAVVQALIELREETGIIAPAKDLIDLGTIYPNSGLLASEVQLFALITDSLGSRTTGTDLEVTEFDWFPISEVLSLANSGVILDSFTLSALLKAAVRGLVKI
jgi:8-oxo-dGTP pyrophosphatase MutT (NUDIX family)